MNLYTYLAVKLFNCFGQTIRIWPEQTYADTSVQVLSLTLSLPPSFRYLSLSYRFRTRSAYEVAPPITATPYVIMIRHY